MRCRPLIDLLPDRCAKQVAEWLSQHSTVELVSRDRFGLYAQAAVQGAPQAQQIADQFHLLMKRLCGHLSAGSKSQQEPSQVSLSAYANQFSDGLSTRSTTRARIGPLDVFSLRPSLSCMAVKIEIESTDGGAPASGCGNSCISPGVHCRSTSYLPVKPVLSKTGLPRKNVRALARSPAVSL
jgi:hypothetical protein